jgi:hypothetical protein
MQKIDFVVVVTKILEKILLKEHEIAIIAKPQFGVCVI